MSRPCLHRVLPGLAVACVSLLPAPAAAQDDDFRVGMHVFRRLLHERRMTPLDSWQRVEDDPSGTLLVLLGRPEWPIPSGLTRFLQNGGAVLLATDNPWFSREGVVLTGFGIPGERVRAWEPEDRPRGRFDPAKRDADIDRGKVYRQATQPDCLVVEPQETPGLTLFWDSPLKRRPLNVVTNRGSFLDVPPEGFGLPPPPPEVRVLARYPVGCWHERRGYLRTGTTPKAFAVGGDVGKGRLLVLADHSVFINEMMIQEDTDNLDFASNAVEWLRDSGQRNRVLFVEDGTIQKKLDVPLMQDEMPLRLLQIWFAETANDVMKQVQERHRHENHLNTGLITGVSEVSGRALFGGKGAENFYILLLVLASVVLVCYGLSRLAEANIFSVLLTLLVALILGLFGLSELIKGGSENLFALSILAHALGLGIFGLGRFFPRSRFFEPAVPLLAHAVAQHAPAGSPLVMRQRLALAEDDLREFGREAARDWFAELPGAPDSPGAALPLVAVHGMRRGASVRKQLHGLWFLAYGDEYAPPMNRMGFLALLDQLDRLRDAVERGDVQLTWQPHV